MTRIVVILCLFFILFFPYWFIQWTAFFILFIIVGSFAYSRLTYYAVSVARTQSIVRAYRRQVIEIALAVENNGFLPVHYCSVVDNPGGLWRMDESRFMFGLSGGQKRRLTYRLKGSMRGEYLIGPIIVASSDPLGIFPWVRRIEEQCTIIIYPSVFRVTREVRSGHPGGTIKVSDKTYEDVTRLKSIREYIPGDDVRHISWKISARLGGLYTREYLQALHSPVLLALNLSLEDYPVKHRYVYLEKAIEICASLVVFFSSLRQEVGLLSTGLVHDLHPVVRIRGGHSHATMLLEQLAVVKGCGEDADIIGLIRESPIP
ncbi:MAG: DUF58 domain-containing protein, partial [Spirochaetales bacterium]|nr:DUF58 domain-containing protein [Spirochaetales bacterium]